MLWLLPINGPVLVVWVHNLAVHWLTPFSSHHNVLSIMPFILLVETLTSGKMVPRVTSKYVSLPIHIFPNPLIPAILNKIWQQSFPSLCRFFSLSSH